LPSGTIFTVAMIEKQMPHVLSYAANGSLGRPGKFSVILNFSVKIQPGVYSIPKFPRWAWGDGEGALISAALEQAPR